MFKNLRDAEKEEWFGNAAFMALPPADMQVLIDNPDRFENFAEFSKLKTKIEQAENTSDILNIMFDMNEDQFTDIINDLSQKAIVDPSVRALRNELKAVQAGLSSTNPKDLLDALMSEVSVDDFINGTNASTSLMDRLAALEEQAKKAKIVKDSKLPDTKQTLLSKVMDDKKLTPDELSSFETPAKIKEVYSIMSRLEGVDISAMPSQEDYIEVYINYPKDAVALEQFKTTYSTSSATEQSRTEINKLPTVNDIAARANQIRRYWYGGADKPFKATLLKDIKTIKNDINTKANAAQTNIEAKLSAALAKRYSPEFSASFSSNRAKKESDLAIDQYISSLKKTMRQIEKQRLESLTIIGSATKSSGSSGASGGGSDSKLQSQLK